MLYDSCRVVVQKYFLFYLENQNINFRLLSFFFVIVFKVASYCVYILVTVCSSCFYHSNLEPHLISLALKHYFLCKSLQI